MYQISKVIDVKKLIPVNGLKFIPVNSINSNFIDVIYNNERIAIINGFSAPLQWTAKNGSRIPVNVIDKLESIVKKAIIK